MTYSYAQKHHKNYNRCYKNYPMKVDAWVLKEYSSLQENPYNVRYIHTVLIVHIYFAPWGVDSV